MSRTIVTSLAVLCGGTLCAAGLAIALMDHGDPLDRFRVIAVTSDAAGRHAVTYWHRHANSSGEVYATWILRERPPIGSTERPAAPSPVLVSSSQHAASPVWTNGRLTATVAAGADVRQELSPCYFDDPRGPLVCVDPARVDVR